MNPLTTEQQYQLLCQSLPLMASRRMRLLRILEFLSKLTDPVDLPALRAYGPELLQPFLREIGVVDLEGTPLSFAGRLWKMLELLRLHIPGAAEVEAWQIAFDALTRERQEMRTVLRRKTDETAMGPVHAKLHPAHDASRPTGRSGVTIPVVEQEFLLRTSEPVFGCLRTVHVEIHFSRRTQGEDEIFVDQVFDPDGAQHRQVRQAVQLARVLLRQFADVKENRRLIVHCTFDEPNVIAGESLGAALAFAVFEELVHLFRLREAVALRHDVAITGVTDADGNVHAVDDAGLRLKVQACAYSRIRFLVIPREQLPIALTVIEELAHDEEGRPSLVLIGVSALQEILFDRRLTVVKRIPLGIYLADRVWGYRRPVLAVTLVTLMVVVGRLWYGPLDRSPDRLEFERSDLVVRNKGNEVLWRVRVGTAMAVTSRQALESQRSSQLAVIADVDGDGSVELLAVRESDEGTGVSNELCCWRLFSPEPVWRYQVQHHVDAANIRESLEDRFAIQGIVADDADGDGIVEVVVIACHPKRYPAVLTVLQGSSGRELARYLHVGRLNDVLVAQLAGDTGKSVVTCGINNAFREASLVVFDPRLIRGVSPTAGEWTPKTFSHGTEKYYILFPRTVVGEAFKTQNYGNMGLHVGVNGEREIRYGIEDFKAFVPELGQTVSGMLTCVLGRGLRFEGEFRSEVFDLTAEILERKGRIPQRTGDGFLVDYGKTLRYWDGLAWQKRPTLNRWSRAVNSSEDPR